MKKYSLQLIALFALVIIGVIALAGGRFAAHAAGSGGTLSGWAWSSNIGWLSFNSADNGAGGGPYSVSVDSSGKFSGYAWSPNIGWVNFGLNSCGSQPNVNLSSGAVSGWAQAVAADNNSWNGCIELSGTNHSTSDSSGNSGVSYVTSGSNAGQFVGYAWGSTNIGWLQFNPSTSVSPVKLCQTGDTTCPNPNQTTDLVFQAQTQDLLNTGVPVWDDGSVTYVIQSQDGYVIVPIRWIPNNATKILTASTSPSVSPIVTDWGENSGSDTSPGGTKFNTLNNATGTDSFTFTNSSSNRIVKKLVLSYTIGRAQTDQEIDINIDPYSQNNLTCSVPAHATSTACGTSITGPAKTISICPTSQIPDCQFTCLKGYTAKNNMCVKSSIREI